jgi:titin
MVYKGTSSSVEKTIPVGVTNTTTVTSLTNGTSYRFKVTATNLQQTSIASSFSPDIIPAPAAAAPGLPTSVSATAGDGSATVSWRAPLSSGSSAITKYTVKVYAAHDTNTELNTIEINGTAAITANTNSVGIISIPVTDLTNGNSYIFKITATNSQLTSEFVSTPILNPVSSVTKPGAPTIISVARGDKSIIVKLNPVSADLTGGKPITKYTISVYTADSAIAVKSVEFSGSTINTNPILATVPDLTNGTAYTFKATATNESNLTSEYSPSSPSIEPDLAPGPPTIISATPGDKSATITWDPPTPNGGTPIREYRVSSDKGQFVDVSGDITTATIDKLFNNTLYKFTVIAKNSFLISPPSTDSDSIKPSAALSLSGPPTELQATVASDKKVSLTWGPPISLGGATSVTYNVYVCSDNFCNSKLNTINNVTSYTTDSLQAGTYYFHVMAVNSYGPSNPAKKSVTILGEHTDISGVPKDISGATTDISGVPKDISGATTDISGVTPSIIGGIISGMNTKTSLSYILSTPPKKDEDEEEDISGVKVSNVSGIVKPLSLYAGLTAYQSDPMTSMLISVVLLGAIFMALFSSYSPIRIKNFYR